MSYYLQENINEQAITNIALPNELALGTFDLYPTAMFNDFSDLSFLFQLGIESTEHPHQSFVLSRKFFQKVEETIRKR